MRRGKRASRGPSIAIALLMLALVVVAGILWRIYPEYRRLRARPQAGSQASSEASPSRPARGAVARLYFVRVFPDKLRLVGVSRELPARVGPARAALQELIQGELPAGCERPLPKGTSIRGIRVSEGTAIVDFSEELVSEFPGGSENEAVTLYAIVNTLTSLPTVDRVQILVEGKPISSIGGHLDASQPLGFDGELVVESP